MNFISLDFETAKPHCPCQIGIVVVQHGEIVERLCELIRPPGNEYGFFEKLVHGITPRKTANSPAFPEVWERVKHLFDGQTVVAHNAGFDRSVLRKALEYYNLPYPNIAAWHCTYQMTDFKLNIACQLYNIPFSRHHDALADAEACANLFIALSDPHFDRYREYTPPTTNPYEEIFERARPNLAPVEAFAGKKIIITGETAIEREYLYSLLQSLGAKPRTTVGSTLNIIVTGNVPGWRKMEVVEEINANGGHIHIWTEEELYEVLQAIIDKYGFANERPAGSPPIGSLF
jgi:DNA polymerase-3 subunit epsilon